MITRGDNEKGDLRMTKCSEEVERQSAHDGKRATSCKTTEYGLTMGRPPRGPPAKSNPGRWTRHFGRPNLAASLLDMRHLRQLHSDKRHSPWGT